MVEISEIQEEPPTQPQQEVQVAPSQERLLDAQEIESVAQTVSRSSVRLQLESLAKKLRKESEALSRVEKSKHMAAETKLQDDDAVKKDPIAKSTTAPPAPTPQTVAATTPAVAPPGGKYTPIDRFSFDFGEYNSAFVSIYIALPGVGSIPKEQISCQFTKDTFDLIVRDLESKSYRLFKDNLEKDINPEKSKFIVKADKVIVKLAKIKGEYGSYDYWSKLTDPKRKSKAASSSKDNPQASIMEMMKEMYETGDENMKKVIGETMMKQQRGELGKDGGMGGGLGDMNLGKDFDDDDAF